MNTLVLVLVTLLVLSVGYIAYTQFSNWKQQQGLTNFQKGAQYGYIQAVSQLFNQVKTCQQVPINVKNQTLKLIAVECLKHQKQGNTSSK